MIKPAPTMQPQSGPPVPETTRERSLSAPYLSCRVVDSAARVYGRHQSRAAAETALRKYQSESGCAFETLYIWDTSHAWEPSNADCWIPIAKRRRDQWVPGLTEDTVRINRGPVRSYRADKCEHRVDLGHCRICDGDT